ncbi:CinA family nicotinamide mononucleotide deamidase-related protein [Croceivirga sp. JEA036]|uniref:CinA family nicotinamide mononucleotide deamidase-related protein n=1 Tax=Croceivirga sp. JEA036 TaxID=2721162 RepID=UPI00143C150D|nr:CinA family nicotinamide mononucleotide deamidase-related protein [Croceivirga sp. JEA036]NJB38051.1 CinA family nicotinamide mononucleotide deamidase-related protein [Croceivirga sp. JEA036]
MQAEIITIGDEILIGQIVDTNATYMSKALNKIGVSVYQITSIQDTKAHILEAFEAAKSRVDLVLITGGLGPTKDDVTKIALCEYFDDVLVKNDAVLEHIEMLFEKYVSTPISDMNRQQAQVPSKAEVLHNQWGTAPGMWLQKDGVVFVSMPGVPYEMKNLMEHQVIPRIVKRFDRPYIIHRTINTYGLGESAIAERIETWENNLPSPVKLAYLPSLGKVRLRLSATGKQQDVLAAQVEEQVQLLLPQIKDIVFGEESDEEIEATIGRALNRLGKKLATAESFTGGKIANQLLAIPGASGYFRGSMVTYATDTKINVLGVPENVIENYSVVSAEVAKAMVERIMIIMEADFAIATTGNAGPTKGDSDAEVGTVFIAIGSPSGVTVHNFNFGDHRERVVNRAVGKALELLQKEILNF